MNQYHHVVPNADANQINDYYFMIPLMGHHHIIPVVVKAGIIISFQVNYV